MSFRGTYTAIITPFRDGNIALANEFAEAGEGLHQASLIYLGLVLFFITTIVLALSKLLLARLQRSEGSRS
jgi:phosphate transport system permease protein